MRFFVELFLLLGLFLLQGCMQEKPVPSVQSDTKVQEIKQVQKAPTKEENTPLMKQYTLRVEAPAHARVRILNIKPKYHDNIKLDAGKYLIEVTKKGYQKYKNGYSLIKTLR
ncbi:MAG: hypothetical protein FAF04_07985 [Epsilonproteobacteria bacterium]|nr:hypothetical protein [Campylobacterota bacterium]